MNLICVYENCLPYLKYSAKVSIAEISNYVEYSLEYPICNYRIPVEVFLKNIQKNKAHNLVYEENGN